jgi:hypothetical protein
MGFILRGKIKFSFLFLGGKEIDIGIIDHISHFGHTESHGRTGKAIKVKKVMIINKVNCSFGSKIPKMTIKMKS